MKFKYLVFPLLALCMLTACGGTKKAETSATETVFSRAENVCLLDNEACAYTLLSPYEDDLGNYCWSVELVNRSGRELVFSMDDVYADDCKLDPCWAQSLAAGTRATSTVTWDGAEMAACGVSEVTRVDFTLTVYPSGSDTAESVCVPLTVYPQGTEAYKPRARQTLATDTALLDTGSAALVMTGTERTETGFRMAFYLENRMEETAVFSLENTRVNGQRCGASWVCCLDGGKKSCFEVSWSENDLRRMELSEVTEITFDLVARDSSGARTLCNESLTVRP